MKYEMKFGSLPSNAKKVDASNRFRIALLGDFSCRANSGQVETGDALAARKPMRVDFENLDDLIDRLDIELKIGFGSDEGGVETMISSIDDFHPDELYDNLEVFDELSGLRSRLNNSSTFASAANEVKSWLGDEAVERHAHRRKKSRSNSVPTGKLSDFAGLIGRETNADWDAQPADEVIKRIVGPFVTADADPRQDQMVAAVDEALSGAMRGVLHDPDFQSLESLWRSVQLLTQRLETDTSLQIVLYDVTADEIAADLAATDDLAETGLYKWLVEQPSLDTQQGALSVLVGNYTFDLIPPHAELLGRMAKLAAAANAPFVASVSKEALEIKKPEEIHPLVADSWNALRQLPEAAYLGLTVPRFMLRWPYGAKTEPIDPFKFEEFTNKSGVAGMLWGNSAILVGLLLGKAFMDQGKIDGMAIDKALSVDDMPFYYYTDKHGDQIALPCTDRLINERLAAHVTSQNFIPILSMKGQPEARVGGMKSLAGGLLAGPWGAVAIEPAAPAAPAATETKPAAEEAPAATPPADESKPDEPTPPADDDDDDTDAELEALLAGLDDDSPSDSAPAADDGDDDEVDPELAALLEGL